MADRELAEVFAQIARELQVGTSPEQTGARLDHQAHRLIFKDWRMQPAPAAGIPDGDQ